MYNINDAIQKIGNIRNLAAFYGLAYKGSNADLLKSAMTHSFFSGATINIWTLNEGLEVGEKMNQTTMGQRAFKAVCDRARVAIDNRKRELSKKGEKKDDEDEFDETFGAFLVDLLRTSKKDAAYLERYGKPREYYITVAEAIKSAAAIGNDELGNWTRHDDTGYCANGLDILALFADQYGDVFLDTPCAMGTIFSVFEDAILECRPSTYCTPLTQYGELLGEARDYIKDVLADTNDSIRSELLASIEKEIDRQYVLYSTSDERNDGTRYCRTNYDHNYYRSALAKLCMIILEQSLKIYSESKKS